MDILVLVLVVVLIGALITLIGNCRQPHVIERPDPKTPRPSLPRVERA
jgi:hypothetical protein